MPKTLLQKMYHKPEYASLFLHIPIDVKSVLATNNSVDTEMKRQYDFILACFTKKEDVEREIPEIKQSLKNTGLLWIAYPKAKALETDLNRDIIHQTLQKYTLDGVSLISLDNTWSAMRFKKV